MTLKAAATIHTNKPARSDPRRCQQAAAPTTREAKGDCLFIAIILASCWGVLGIGLVMLAKAIMPLEKLATSPPTRLVQVCIAASMVGGWGLVVLFSTVVLWGSAQRQLQLANEIERDGVAVPGVLIDKWIWGGEIPSHCVGYRFTCGGTTWIGRDIVKASLYKGIEIGASVAVRCLPRDLRISRIELDAMPRQ